MIQRSIGFLLLLASWPIHALPDHSPWPGGIAVLRIPGKQRPAVTVDDRRVLVVRGEGEWIALVGIPLDHEVPGPLVARVSASNREVEEIAIELKPMRYREQRLAVDRKYLELGPEELARIDAERSILDAALANRRSVELSDVSLEPPVAGPRSASFGLRRVFNGEPRSPHKGMDIAAAPGTPVLSPMAGQVSVTGDFFFTGNTVVLDHGQGLISLYCHLREIDTKEGRRVAAGTHIGTVGATGRATGPHLHFGVYLGGTAVDPALLLRTAD